MIILTGGAGFIGSCILRVLNDSGIEDIIVVDHIKNTDKWMNLRNKKYIEYICREDFLAKLLQYKGKVSHVIHMGACSSTTEKNFDFLYKNNFEFTKTLWEFCTEENISFIYASSAATYGAGEFGFDDKADIEKLLPLNGYGYSKHLFDLWLQKEIENGNKIPKQYVGFKFFNVYGPNEYFKGDMASVVFHTFNEVKRTGKKGLFKSYRDEYEDGKQLRDFVYVKDICNAVCWMMKHPEVNGIFNLGTGQARTFYDLAKATFRTMGVEEKIEYIEMPENLKGIYQYYTEANMEKLKEVGFQNEFYDLESGIEDYVKNYLMQRYLIW